MVINIKKIRGLMKKYGLKCPIRKANPYRRMAKALKTSYVAPNLLNREFETHGPRAVLLTDITYISNGKAPHCYLSAIIDAFTKNCWPGTERISGGGFRSGDREPADGAPWPILTGPSPDPQRPGRPLYQREVCPAGEGQPAPPVHVPPRPQFSKR